MRLLNTRKSDMVLCVRLGRFISKGIIINERIKGDWVDESMAQDTSKDYQS
jgi:hypothetical protein